MKYLLDTNIFIYLIEKDFNRLSIEQRIVISNPNNELFVSEATYFEMSIKFRLQKKLLFNFNVSEIELYRKGLNIKLLKSKTDYYLGITDLSKVYITDTKLHGDPFDLLIISQALHEKMPILSSDRLFPNYEEVTVIS